MQWNLIARFRILSGGQYAIRLRSAQDIPEPSSLWGSTLGTRAVRMMIAALHCVWPQFQWYQLAYATEIKKNQLHDSTVVTWPLDSINYVTLHPYSLLHQTSHSNSKTCEHRFQIQIGFNHNFFQQTDRTCMQRFHDWVKGHSMSVSYIFIYMFPSKHLLQ